jgi:hypothetical protein
MEEKKEQPKGKTIRFYSEDDKEKIKQMCEYWEVPLNYVVRNAVRFYYTEVFLEELKEAAEGKRKR